jgi:hypothetical protein
LSKSLQWAASAALGVALCLPVASQASALGRVDFEAAPPLTVFGPGQADSSYSEAGFRFTPSGNDAQVDLSFCSAPDFCAVGNDTQYLTAFNDASVTITAESGGAFSLGSFEASFVPSPALDYSSLSILLTLSGALSGGGTASQTFALLGTGAGDYLFSGYSVDEALRNTTALTISACFFDGSSCVHSSGLSTNDAQFALDNLAFVPEPSALWLAGLALAGLALTRRAARR